MKARLDALFPTADPVVAVRPSRGAAEATLTLLARAGYGRRMLGVIDDAGRTVVRPADAPVGAALRWGASGWFWGALWAILAVAAAFALPLGGATSGALLMAGALTLVLQTSIVARAVAPEREGHAPAAAPRIADLAAVPARFLIVVRGSRSEISLARLLLAE